MSAPVPAARPARRSVVVASLSGLHGPGSGLVRLPRRLYWSGEDENAVFSMDDPDQAGLVYEQVLDSARTVADLAGYLNADLLRVLWPNLGMTRERRQAWEAVNPELAAARAPVTAA
jgi:hypothetical protein